MPKQEKSLAEFLAETTPEERLEMARKKVHEGRAGARKLAKRLNLNLRNDAEIDRTMPTQKAKSPEEFIAEHSEEERLEMARRKARKGREGAKELAAALNYNLTHDEEPKPEPPKTFEDAFLSRLRQYDQSEEMTPEAKPVASYLFIGGPHDGLNIPVADDQDEARLRVDVAGSERYLRDALAVGDMFITIYRNESLTSEQVLDLFVQFYKAWAVNRPGSRLR